MTYLHRLSFFFFLLAISAACSSSAGMNKNQDPLSLEAISIGKNQTAVIAKIVAKRTEDEQIILTLAIEQAKQGGAQAELLTKGTQIEAVCTKTFQRVYLEKNETELDRMLKPKEKILALISHNIKDDTNQIDFLKR